MLTLIMASGLLMGVLQETPKGAAGDRRRRNRRRT